MVFFFFFFIWGAGDLNTFTRGGCMWFLNVVKHSGMTYHYDEGLDEAERARKAAINARVRERGQTMSFSRPAVQALRELSGVLKTNAFPSLTYSQLLEMLLANWERSNPGIKWCQDFHDTKMKTKRGRPRASVDRPK